MPVSADLQKARQLKAESQLPNSSGVRQRSLLSSGADGSTGDGATDSSTFQLLIRGEIDAVRGGPTQPQFVTFAFSHGPDWSPLSGAIFGTSQETKSSISSVGTRVSKWEGVDGIGRAKRNAAATVNYPFDVVYKSSTPHGWPRLSVAVYGQDWCNRRVMVGTGSCVLPAQPGTHKRSIRIVKPSHPSWFGRFMMWLSGRSYEDDISDPSSLRLHHVESDVGVVDVHFEILMKDAQKFRFQFTSKAAKPNVAATAA